MEFITEIIIKHFKLRNSELLISLELAEFLVDADLDDLDLVTVNFREYIILDDDVVSSAMGLTSFDQSKIKKYLFCRGYSDPIYEDSLVDIIYKELLDRKKIYKRFVYDFRSYGLSLRESINKAKTFSSYQVLHHFYKLYGSERVLYRALKKAGDIRVPTPKRFCSELKWVHRIGLYKGILLGKERINIWTTNKIKYGYLGIRK